MNGEVQTPENVKRLINSSAVDAVYLTSGGKPLSGKHCLLGLSQKSMNCSKTIVNVLNQPSHCVSNEKFRLIDSGMETSIAHTTKLRPSNIRKDTNACIGLAWSNFDINLETSSEAGSVHHTYGICYQNISVDGEDEVHLIITTMLEGINRRICKCYCQ